MFQKLNVKSSTEAEIVALSDKLSDLLWTQFYVQSLMIDANKEHKQNPLIIFRIMNLV